MVFPDNTSTLNSGIRPLLVLFDSRRPVFCSAPFAVSEQWRGRGMCPDRGGGGKGRCPDRGEEGGGCVLTGGRREGDVS